MAASDFPDALASFAKLLGLIDANGLSFTWFDDPAANSLKAMPANREEIGNIFSYLAQGATEPDQTFPGNLKWQPLTAGPVDVGFVWNTDTDLKVGFGARASAAGKPISALAEFFTDSNGNVSSDIGRVVVQLPVPPFLGAITLVADAIAGDLQFTVADTSQPVRTRTLHSKTSASPGWDGVRIGLFVLQAWLKQYAQGKPATDIAARLSQHLFPLLGDMAGATGIQASALVDSAAGASNMGTVPNFASWGTSAITTDAAKILNAATFLWHIRALLTGEQSSSLIGSAGSIFMPLVPGAGDTPGAPSAATLLGPYPPAGTAAGAWIGIRPAAGSTFDLVLAVRAANQNAPAEITLANAGAGGVKIPTIALPNWTAIDACLKQLPTLQIGPSTIKAALQSPTQWSLTLLSQTVSGSGVPGFDGVYSLNLVIDKNTGLSFHPSIPAFPLAMPPAANDVLFTILNWLSTAAPQTGPLQATAQALIKLAQSALLKQPLDPAPLLIALTQAAVAALKGDTGPLALSFLDKAKNNDAVLKTALTLGPFDPGKSSDSFPVHIGTVGANVQIDLTAAPRFYGFGLSFSDLRLGDQSGGGSLIGSLLPNLNKIKGFSMDVGWTNGGSVTVSGSGTIPIQQTLGPLDIGSLTIDVRNKSLQVGVDLGFKLGPIDVSTQDLGLKIGFDGSGSLPFLQGLGLSLDTSFIKLQGLFGKSGNDYIGGAVVSIVDMFQVSAIGAYTQVQGSPSLFIFASLVAPLGGTPWMFITGVAGGFGLNRKLPSALPLNKNPFLEVMSGKLDFGDASNAGAELQTLGKEFEAVKGDFWVAGGIQFLSFGLIHGKVVVAVAFGHDFSIQLLGSASFGISSIAYFEIDIAVTADAEKFLLVASLSPSSYILDPKIFSLEGDFALGVWHGGEHAGDFLLSIGGYHPYYTAPDYYPTLNRVGVKATIDLGLTIHIVIECFFACTPQALMAGASASISASIGGIAAGLDVYVDVLIQWDPFFIRADLGVTVWFVFFGRHEIGVDLDIHTPPFGGTATVHLFIVSFTFSFGSSLLKPPAPSITQFASKQLHTSAVETNKGVANIPAFNLGSKTGLLTLALTWGRAGALQDKSSTKQEGTDSKNPILVNAEFIVEISTRLPFTYESKAKAAGQVALLGITNLALCNKHAKHSTLTVKGSGVDLAIVGMKHNHFPAAEFGDTLPDSNDAARQSVADLDTKHPSVPLTHIASFSYFATQAPVTPPAYQGRPEQESEGAERFPLPLASNFRVPVRVQQSAYQFSAAVAGVGLKPRAPFVTSAQAAERAISQAVKTPLTVTQLAASWARESALGPKHTAVAAPKNAAVISVPLSPARRAEMAGIALRVMPMRAPAPKTNILIKRIALAPRDARRTLTPAGGAANSHKSAFTVAPGQALHTDISGTLVRSGTLTSTGKQAVRAILLGAGEEPLSDAMLAAGNQTLAAPMGLRSVYLIGEGGDPHTAEAQGIEGHCTLLALGRRTFAGLGCVLESQVALEVACHPLDNVPASQILPSARTATVHFSAPAKAATLILKVSAATPNPGPAASDVRWRSVDATLGAVKTTAGPHGATLVMQVDAPGAWTLDLDLGLDWKLSGVVVTPTAPAAVLAQITSQAHSNLVDDRFYADASLGASSITLEIVQ